MPVFGTMGWISVLGSNPAHSPGQVATAAVGKPTPFEMDNEFLARLAQRVVAAIALDGVEFPDEVA